MPRRTVSLLALVALFLRRRAKGIKAEDAARVAKCSIRTAHRLLSEMNEAGLLAGGGRAGYLLRRVPGRPRR
jgi:DNA-binding IclR family transcriptional regulator